MARDAGEQHSRRAVRCRPACSQFLRKAGWNPNFPASAAGLSPSRFGVARTSIAGTSTPGAHFSCTFCCGARKGRVYFVALGRARARACSTYCSGTPPRGAQRAPLLAPRIHGLLTRLATKPCQKWELVTRTGTSFSSTASSASRRLARIRLPAPGILGPVISFSPSSSESPEPGGATGGLDLVPLGVGQIGRRVLCEDIEQA